MRKQISIVLLSVVAGCSSGSTGKTEQAGEASDSTQRPERQSLEKFDGIDQAIGVLAEAAEADASQRQANATRWLGAQGAPAIEPLVAAINNPGTGLKTKIAICQAFGKIARADKAAAARALTELCRNDEYWVRINATKQLSLIRPSTQQIVETLVELMDHEDVKTAVEAARGLGRIGSPAKDLAGTRLLSILNSQDADDLLRREAKKSLRSVDPRRTLID